MYKMLLVLAGIGLDLTYKVGSFIIGGALSGVKRLVFGKPPIEKRLDDLFMKMEEQRIEIIKLEEELHLQHQITPDTSVKQIDTNLESQYIK